MQNKRKGTRCSDFVVSSYTPTIGALLTARRRHKPNSRTGAHLLLAAVPKPFEGKRLNGVTAELKAIVSAIRRSGRQASPEGTSIPRFHAPIVIGSAAAADVLCAIPDASRLHFACHGEQDPKDALNSGLSMRDRRLQVSDLMALDLSGVFLAFLSACETARGDERQPDQVVHLAATMLFAGFRSVVRTMWCALSPKLLRCPGGRS